MDAVTKFVESQQGLIQMDSPATFELELFSNENRSFYISYGSVNDTGNLTNFFVATEDLDFKTNNKLYPYMFHLLVELLSMVEVEIESIVIEQLADMAIEEREILYEELVNEVMIEVRPNINTATDEIFSLQILIYQNNETI